MVRLINRDQRPVIETEEEKKEKLQREQDFAGEFGEVRKSGLSASADKIISDSKPINPLKSIKLFNQIDEDDVDNNGPDAINLSDFEREKEGNPRKRHKTATPTVPSKPTNISHTQSSQSSIDGTPEAIEPLEEPIPTSRFPKLVKLQDDSFPNEDDDELEMVVQLEKKTSNSVRHSQKDNDVEQIIVDSEEVVENVTNDSEEDLAEEVNKKKGDEEVETVDLKPKEATERNSNFQEETQSPKDGDDADDDEFFDAQDSSESKTKPEPKTKVPATNISVQDHELKDAEPVVTKLNVLDSDILKLKVKLYSKFTGRSDIIPYGLEPKYKDIYRLVEATVKDRESQSALIIGPKNSGKTACLNLALKELRSQVKDRSDEFLLIKLSGSSQENDKIAVKSIARQLDSEISRVYKVNVKELDPSELLTKKSITETFSNILNILDKQVLLEDETKGRIHIPIVFVINEVEVYANPNRQTLLYNLFDLVENSSTPMTTICLSTKFTVKDLLEKRVRSRFSQRMIQFTKFNLEEFMNISHKILSIDEPDNEYEIQWNANIEGLIAGPSNLRELIIHNHLTVNNFKEFHNHCTYPLSKISTKQPFLNDKDFKKYASNNMKSSWRNIINSLSEIELSLLVSAARLVTRNDLNWINLNTAYEEYQTQAKMQNKNRSANVFNTTSINTGSKVWQKERCEEPWKVLQRLGLLTPPTNAGKSGKTMDFSNNTAETKMWQVEVTLDELRFVVDSDKSVKSWTRL